MPERKRRTEENIEDVQRVSDTLNRRARKGKRRNPFLKPVCGSELQEVYSNNQIKNKKFRRDLTIKVLKTRKSLRSGDL